MNQTTLIFFLLLALHHLSISGVISAKFTLANKCNYTVWPGIVSSSGTASLSTTGFVLQTGQAQIISAPESWSGRFWARTLCTQNSTAGSFACVTGDCGSGKIECAGNLATQPATWVEFTLGGSRGLDFFDVSLVDGFNVPIEVVPSSDRCNSTGCPADLNGACPLELKVTIQSVNGEKAVACKSACKAFATPQYCCNGTYNTPDTCKPTNYSRIFKSACPRAYSYAFDDETSTFTCASSSTDYTITFCPAFNTRIINETLAPQPASSPSRPTGEVAAPKPASSPSRPTGTGKRKVQSLTIIVVVVPILSLLMLFCVGCYFFQRRKRKSYKAILRDNFGSESNALESLQFDLATIEAATNKFSNENRIGEGGFGEVYKGILPDQRRIAVKRLSKSSGQGVVQFKNEVLLIAKLQHRNLVALLGFCLQEQEKILVYEYVPNNSLDYFLFGPQKRRVLTWSERYKIVEGIARGILYLHEYSRIKVIHRDLKPSNILLDDNMNPKISDFGLARMVAIDEIQGSTNKIVGTFGYMSPEYVMLGQFSDKSDIFSFGVMILEIISGKKNASSHASQPADGLLSHAWKQWKDEKALELLDPNLTEEVCSNIEVTRCIQIGLLCVQENPDARPTMATVVSYLSNQSIQLPVPQEPAFYMHGRMQPTIETTDANNPIPTSINDVSLSAFFPR